MITRRGLLQAGLGAAALAMRPAARAQGFEQARILFGFPAGSAGDTLARRVAERLAAAGYGKVPALVDNRPGAGGRIALEALKAAPADGSVLALVPLSCIAIYPHVYTKLRYTPADFTPVSIAATGDHGLAVGPAVPAAVKTVEDFLQWARVNPMQANYGSPGAGSTPHFLGALLGLAAKVELKHVPYRGSVPGVADLLGGQVAAMLTPCGEFLPHHRTGKLRLLATSGAQRSPFTPDVRTFAEQGWPELTVDEWLGFYAPAKTPVAVLQQANAAVNEALKAPGVADSLALVGLVARGSRREEMERSQQTELERWGPLVKRVGFTSDS